MANSRKVIKVFLGSPGDLAEERRAAKDVVEETNALLAEKFGYQVELVGWEDTVSMFGRPQAIINRDLERCELFLGLMWKRWGTPPDINGPYSSGFEEEFKTSVARRLASGQPEISLFFKEIDSELLRDPGDELKKVLTFKEKLLAEKQILFENFADIRDFEAKVRRCIIKYILGLHDREVVEASDPTQAPTASEETRQGEETRTLTPLSAEGAQFLRKFISKTEQNDTQDPVEAVEIARFRLLASLIGSHANDEKSLGVHDANLIFAKSGEFKLGASEEHGLVSSGLEHYANQNAPLWHWVAARGGFAEPLLPIYSCIGSVEHRVAALQAMRLIAEPLPNGPWGDRNSFLKAWFKEDVASNVKVAALEYLGDYGITSDLEAIRQELNSGDNKTVNAATDAIIRIYLRDSRNRAIDALYELQPLYIDRKVLRGLFSNNDALSKETLLKGISHKNSSVRNIVAELLFRRNELSSETAEQLLADTDVIVRYFSLKALIADSRKFSNDEVKKILVTAESHKGGLLAIPDTTAEECLEQFQREQLCSLKDRELEAVANEEFMLSRPAHFALVDRHFKRHSADLRRAIDDQYKTEFDRLLEIVTAKYGLANDLIKKLQELEVPIRQSYVRQGLDIICRQAKQEDLGRVRAILKSKFVSCKKCDLEYLFRFGEWEDIPLILDCESPSYLITRELSFFSTHDSKSQIAARTIVKLSQNRITELLAMPMSNSMRTHIITEIPDKKFRDLGIEAIDLLLRSENDAVRKVAAIKCAKVKTKGQLTKLLSNYIKAAQYYYNVIHWLDFGVSVPRSRATLAVEKAINQD